MYMGCIAGIRELYRGDKEMSIPHIMTDEAEIRYNGVIIYLIKHGKTVEVKDEYGTLRQIGKYIYSVSVLDGKITSMRVIA